MSQFKGVNFAYLLKIFLITLFKLNVDSLVENASF